MVQLLRGRKRLFFILEVPYVLGDLLVEIDVKEKAFNP